MIYINSKTLNNWHISYDAFTDVFQIYDDLIFKIKSNNLTCKKVNSGKITFIKENKEPVLIEFNKAYDKFGFDIDNVKKEIIFNKVISLLK